MLKPVQIYREYRFAQGIAREMGIFVDNLKHIVNKRNELAQFRVSLMITRV